MVSGVSLDLPVHSLGPSRRTITVVGALVVGALFVVGGFSLRGARAVAPVHVDEFAVSVVTVPPEAALRVDGRPVGTGRFSGRFPRNGAAHVLLATAAGWEPQQVTFVDVSPGSEIRLRRLPSPPPRDVAPATAPRPTQAAPPEAPTPVPTTPPAGSSRRTTTRSARHRRADPSMGTPALGPVFVPSAPSIVAGEPSGGSNGASIR